MSYFLCIKSEQQVMVIIPVNKQEAREGLETDLKAFLNNGGKIKEIISDEKRSKKEKLVRQNLFYSAHHAFHAKNTGIAVRRLAEIRRTPSSASDEEMETLWVYFRSREWSVND